MLEQISRQLQQAEPTPPAPHGRVVLFLVFAFILSSWLIYHGVANQVNAIQLYPESQLAIDIAQINP